MKALYCQQNSPGEEMTFIFQERVSSDHNSTTHSVEELVAKCHKGIETHNSSVDLKKNWCNPCTSVQVKESRGCSFYCHHEALGKTRSRFLCAFLVSII